MLRFLSFFRDFLLRDRHNVLRTPAILQYVNGGIGNDYKTRKKPRNLPTRRSRMKFTVQSARAIGLTLGKTASGPEVGTSSGQIAASVRRNSLSNAP